MSESELKSEFESRLRAEKKASWIESSEDEDSMSSQSESNATNTPWTIAEKYDLVIQALNQTGSLQRNDIPATSGSRTSKLSKINYREVNIPGRTTGEVRAAWDSIKCDIRDVNRPGRGSTCTFTCFPQLPTEIRCMIWKFATYQPRVLEAFLDYSKCDCNEDMPGYEDIEGHIEHEVAEREAGTAFYADSQECPRSMIKLTSHTHESLAPQAILRTNRESRAEGIKKFNLINIPGAETPNRVVRFNVEQDTIYFGKGCDRWIYQSYGDPSGRLDSYSIFRGLQHFAMGIEIWERHVSCMHLLLNMVELKTLTLVIRPSIRSRVQRFAPAKNYHHHPSGACILVDLPCLSDFPCLDDLIGEYSDGNGGYLDPDGTGQKMLSGRLISIKMFAEVWKQVLVGDFSGWQWPDYGQVSPEDTRFDVVNEKYTPENLEAVMEMVKNLKVSYAVVERRHA